MVCYLKETEEPYDLSTLCLFRSNFLAYLYLRALVLKANSFFCKTKSTSLFFPSLALKNNKSWYNDKNKEFFQQSSMLRLESLLANETHRGKTVRVESAERGFHNCINPSGSLCTLLANTRRDLAPVGRIHAGLRALGRNRESQWLAGCQIVSTLPSSNVVIFQFPGYTSPA